MKLHMSYDQGHNRLIIKKDGNIKKKNMREDQSGCEILRDATACLRLIQEKNVYKKYSLLY